MKSVKTTLKQAEEVKNKLVNLGIFSKNHEILKDKNYIYFPITKKAEGFEIVEKSLKKKKTKLSFEDLLKKKLNKKELGLVTKAFDVIGDIAVLEIDDSLLIKKKVIAEALLSSIKNIKTVVRKIGEHKGEYRIQNYEYLAGENRFETMHKESGVLLKLNINETYYSPRTASERLRISKDVKKGEKILVMFSGIGVYGFILSKHSLASEIYCAEVNPDSCKYAEEILKLNKIKNVKLFSGDVREVVPKFGKFDRIIMPLPKTSLEFLDLALEHLNKNGIINIYYFSSEEEKEKILEIVKKKCKCKILRIVKTGQQSPKIYRYCLDFKVI